MELNVTGIRGAENATIEIEPGQITLIAGKNGAGKTSIIFGARAVLGSMPLPQGEKKNEFGKAIVNRTRKEGVATIKGADYQRRVTYPDCEIKTLQGQGPHLNRWALGIQKLCDLKDKEKAKNLMDITGVRIGRETILKELEGLNLVPEQIEKLILVALSNDFSTSSKHAEDWAKELKGEFKAITGVQWGSNQGLTFVPEGFDTTAEKSTIEQLKEAVTSGKRLLEDEIGKRAIAETAERFKGKSIEHGQEVQKWTESVKEHKEQLEEYKKQYEAEKIRSQQVKCSGCGLLGVVEDSMLVSKMVTEPGNASSAEQLLELVKKYEMQLSNATYALGLAKSNFDQAVKHEEEQAEIRPADVESARKEFEQREARLKARIAKDKGTDLHFKITDMLEAAKRLSPDGIPRRALNESLEFFNQSLAKLCEFADFKPCEITPELDIRYNMTPYWLCSRSEQYRADALVQIVASRMTEQPMVIMDEVDILDADGRSGLLYCLHSARMAALLGMTVFPRKDSGTDWVYVEVPNLGEIGFGRTYLVAQGNVIPLKVNEAVPAQ